jgi:hypothetical protein
MSAEQIHFFLHLRDQIKLYHWQTRVYSRHIATDKIVEEAKAKVKEQKANEITQDAEKATTIIDNISLDEYFDRKENSLVKCLFLLY